MFSWSRNWFLVTGTVPNQKSTFTVTDTKLCNPVVTFSTQDNAKLLEQFIKGFERTINWNKYQSKITTKAQNQYLYFLIDPSFQGKNRLFVLSFQNKNDRESYKWYFLPTVPTVETKGYNVIRDGRNFFYQPVKNDLRTCNNIQRLATGQGDDCKNRCLLNYLYLEK